MKIKIYDLNVRWHKLAFGLAVIISCSRSAYSIEEKDWPLSFEVSTHSSSDMARVIFSPGGTHEFVDFEGFELQATPSTTLEKYSFGATSRILPGAVSCKDAVQKPGFFQTTKVKNYLGDYSARVAFPIGLEIQSQLTRADKIRFLDSVLFKVKVMQFDSEHFLLRTKHQFNITYADLCRQDADCSSILNDPETPIQLRVEKPVKTPQFTFLKSEKIQIRVEWDFRAMCDVQSSALKIGNQLRVLESI